MAEENENQKPEPKKPKSSSELVNNEAENERRIKALEVNTGKTNELLESIRSRLSIPEPKPDPEPEIKRGGKKEPESLDAVTRVLKLIGLAD